MKSNKSTRRLATSLSALPNLAVHKYFRDAIARIMQAAKGAGVHRLKGIVSWVQYVARQYGCYLLEVFASEGKIRGVRKELQVVANSEPVVRQGFWVATL